MQLQTCSVGLKSETQDATCGFRTDSLRIHSLYSSGHNTLIGARARAALSPWQPSTQTQATTKQVTAEQRVRLSLTWWFDLHLIARQLLFYVRPLVCQCRPLLIQLFYNFFLFLLSFERFHFLLSSQT